MNLKRTRVLTDGGVAVMIFTCAVLTAAFTTIGRELYAMRIGGGTPAPRPAVVQRSTGLETIASIPTRLDGRDVICTLRIDYKTRTWSLAC